MKKCNLVLLIFSLSILVAYMFCVDFFAKHTVLPKKEIRKAMYNVWTEKNTGFITADKVKLLANIYHPKGLKKTPTILVRIPFVKNIRNKIISDMIGRYWAKHGYTAVIQGTRGMYKSGGKFYPLINERNDGIETIKWLKK